MSIFSYSVYNSKEFFSETQSKWMRGITFVHNEGKDDIYPMLPKFFNVNENHTTQIKDLLDLEIESVTNKRDGSLVIPIKINNTVIFKTKNSFDNEHSKICNEIYKQNKNIHTFINDNIDIYIFNIV